MRRLRARKKKGLVHVQQVITQAAAAAVAAVTIERVVQQPDHDQARVVQLMQEKESLKKSLSDERKKTKDLALKLQEAEQEAANVKETSSRELQVERNLVTLQQQQLENRAHEYNRLMQEKESLAEMANPYIVAGDTGQTHPLQEKTTTTMTERNKIITRAATVTQSFIKTEDLLEGNVECPECATVICVSERGCNVVTCRNHKPHFVYFCVHCKQVAAEGYAVCSYPPRNSRESRAEAQKRRNKDAKENPIIFYDSSSDEDEEAGADTETNSTLHPIQGENPPVPPPASVDRKPAPIDPPSAPVGPTPVPLDSIVEARKARKRQKDKERRQRNKEELDILARMRE